MPWGLLISLLYLFLKLIIDRNEREYQGGKGLSAREAKKAQEAATLMQVGVDELRRRHSITVDNTPETLYRILAAARKTKLREAKSPWRTTTARGKS